MHCEYSLHFDDKWHLSDVPKNPRREYSFKTTVFGQALAYDLEHVVGKNEYKGIIIFCDNPRGLNIDPVELISCFNSLSWLTKFIFSSRNTDVLSDGDRKDSLTPLAENLFEVPYELEDAELSSLADMLVKIGAEESGENAHNVVKSLTSKHSMDILCSLWYLVPETKSAISHSLQEEYIKLGEVDGTIRDAARNVGSSSDIAKNAYEAVTVVSSLETGLPMEVMVRFLKIDYQDWIDIFGSGTPIWGLLYDEYEENSDSICYRTRNEIVTKVLLELVNGGPVGRSGEARVIRDLVSACEVGTTVYRDFLLHLLIHCNKRLQAIYSQEDGMKLFNLAIEVLPHPDRTIEHHKGIWMKRDSQNLANAYKQLEYAATCPEYPGAIRSTPVEHVQTTMASTVLRMVQEGQLEKSAGVDAINTHLRLASNNTFFDAHTAHIAANQYFQLACSSSEIQNGVDGISAMGTALSVVENALQKIGAVHSNGNRYKSQKSLEMFRELRSQIVTTTTDLETLKKEAETVFAKSGRGVGFILAARKELCLASERNKGSDFNDLRQYLDECLPKLQVGTPDYLEIQSIRVDLIIRWRLQKEGGGIDWTEFHGDLFDLLSSATYRDDVIKKFYIAVACFHLGDISTSNAYFSQLRRNGNTGLNNGQLRAWFVGKEGGRKRNQCVLKRAGGRIYAEFSELDTDAPVRQLPAGIGIGMTTHCYLGFSLNGATPIFDKRYEPEFLLA